MARLDIVDITGDTVATPTLNIRNLPDDLHARLRVRAAIAGRSMEAEARMILAQACRAQPVKPPSAAELQGIVSDLYNGSLPLNVVDEFIEERRKEVARE